MIGQKTDNRGFASLIALLLVVGMIAYLWIVSMENRPKHIVISNSEVKVQRTDSSNYQTTLDHTIGQIKQLEQQQLDRSEQLLNQMKGIGL